MSIEREILEYLNSQRNKHHLKYKGIRVGLMGLPDFKHYKYQTMANRCADLKKKNYIKLDKLGNYFITFKGIEFLEGSKPKIKLSKFLVTKTDKDPKDLLIIYDIPEIQRSEREWFRRHLKDFHFIMIQKSVWVGPSPLPADFLNYLKEIKIGDNFKTFKLGKGYPNNIKK